MPVSNDWGEILLTPGLQSVMNSFTASDFSVQFCPCCPVSTDDIKTKNMCRRLRLQ
jgi:hypothetical protein